MPVFRLFFIAIIHLLLASPVTAQEPYTPPGGSPEKEAILDALRDSLKTLEIGKVVFVVRYLKVKDGWAWIETDPQTPDGMGQFEPIDALLHKENHRWVIKQIRPCCGECADDPECEDIKRYYKKLMREFPSVPRELFPK